MGKWKVLENLLRSISSVCVVSACFATRNFLILFLFTPYVQRVWSIFEHLLFHVNLFLAIAKYKEVVSIYIYVGARMGGYVVNFFHIPILCTCAIVSIAILVSIFTLSCAVIQHVSTNVQIHHAGAARASQPNNIDTSCRFQIGARMLTTFSTK